MKKEGPISLKEKREMRMESGDQLRFQFFPSNTITNWDGYLLASSN
jgi:hypothetical protein